MKDPITIGFSCLTTFLMIGRQNIGGDTRETQFVPRPPANPASTIAF